MGENQTRGAWLFSSLFLAMPLLGNVVENEFPDSSQSNLVMQSRVLKTLIFLTLSTLIPKDPFKIKTRGSVILPLPWVRNTAYNAFAMCVLCLFYEALTGFSTWQI